MSHLHSRRSPNVSGCCLIGMFLAVFYAIWHIIRAVFIALWHVGAYVFKAIYYIYAWPLLAFEYLWKRGGLYRILSIGLIVIIIIVFASAFLRNTSPNSPGAPAPVEAARMRTHTPTPKRQIISTRTRTRTATVRRPSATRSATPSRTATPLPTTSTGAVKPADAQAAQVVRVIDGDTVDVQINSQVIRLRFIGIDTPESVDPRKPVQCFGIEASNYTKQTLLNQTVYLERDATQGEYDIYDRLLVYVWIDDTTLFNQKIIADGYAFEYTYRLPYRYQNLFKAAQQTARSTNTGLWSPTTCNGDVNTGVTPTTTAVAQSPTITRIPTATMTTAERAYPCQAEQIKGNPDSMIYHVPTGQWYAQTRNSRVVCFDTEQAAILAGYRKSTK
jgi:endonuclease YncB( thermonuclease family)